MAAIAPSRVDVLQPMDGGGPGSAGDPVAPLPPPSIASYTAVGGAGAGESSAPSVSADAPVLLPPSFASSPALGAGGVEGSAESVGVADVPFPSLFAPAPGGGGGGAGGPGVPDLDEDLLLSLFDED